MIGKWHLGSEPELQPSVQGFDHYYCIPSNAGHSPRFFDGEDEIYARAPLDQLTKLYTSRAVDIIEHHGDEPFFLYFAHNYPHTPYKAGTDFVGTSRDGVRGDVIQELDWGIGEMMTALNEAGVADNSIVIFSSDNGPVKAQYAKSYSGTKFVTLEGGHRVPMIFHWPAVIKQGVVSETPLVAMDLFPTLSEIIDQPLPQGREFDGVSMTPLFAGHELDREPTEPFFYYNCENLQATRYGNWKLHLPRAKRQIPFWDKSERFLNLESPVLYNLQSDLQESVDVASENPEIVEQMVGMAEDARTELGEFMQRGSGQLEPSFQMLPSSVTAKIGRALIKQLGPPFIKSV